MVRIVFYGMHAEKLNMTKACAGDKLLFGQLVQELGLQPLQNMSGNAGFWSNYEGFRHGATKVQN
jgi:hypothetical protein